MAASKQEGEVVVLGLGASVPHSSCANTSVPGERCQLLKVQKQTSTLDGLLGCVMASRGHIKMNNKGKIGVL